MIACLLSHHGSNKYLGNFWYLCALKTSLFMHSKSLKPIDNML